MLIVLALASALQAAPVPRVEPELARPDFVAVPAPGCFDFLAADPEDPDTLFGYSDAPADLHRSDDGGRTWATLGGLPNGIASLRVSPTRRSTVFATGFGFYVSSDRGETWERALTAPPDLNGSLVIDPYSAERLYVASNSFRGGTNVGELWFSPDEGAHWARKENGLPIGQPGSPISGLVASPHEQGFLLIGTSNGVYGTRDGGDHWDFLSGEQVLPIGFDAGLADVVWGWYGDSLFLSPDGGSTWEPRTVDCCPGTGDQSGLLRIVPDPLTPGGAWALTQAQFPSFFSAYHVLRSVDYGATWQWADSGIDGTPPAVLRELILSADGRRLWVTDCGRSALFRRELRRVRAVPPR